MTSKLDGAFRALAHPERRRLLNALADHNPQSDQSFEYPDDVPLESIETKDYIHMRMHHNHLPMLEKAGFIEWHTDDREITKGPNFDVILPLLQVIDDDTARADVTNGL